MAIDKNKLVKVTNRWTGTVGYDVQDMSIPHRNFFPRETKEVTFEELEKLAADPAGLFQLKNRLVIKDYEVAKALLPDVEPEYFYEEADVKRLLTESNNYNEFLDCLDFAPDGVIDLIQKYAVELPLNDIAKREAIREKTGFNVTAAIAVENARYDGDEDSNTEAKENKTKVTSGRRAATPTINNVEVPQRRVVIKKD